MVKNLEPLADIYALPPGPKGLPGNAPIRAAEAGEVDIVHEDLARFRKAGWTFSRKPVPRGRPVFRDATGHIVIGGNSLILKFKPDLSSDEISTYIKKHALSVLKTIGVRRDCYVVRYGAEDGLVHACEALAQDKEVEWVEPNLIEFVSAR